MAQAWRARKDFRIFRFQIEEQREILSIKQAGLSKENNVKCLPCVSDWHQEKASNLRIGFH